MFLPTHPEAGTGKGSGADPVRGTYQVYVNNLCPECEWGHLDLGKNGDGLWDISWWGVHARVCVLLCVCAAVCVRAAVGWVVSGQGGAYKAGD
jgi:hypothetical protein